MATRHEPMDSERRRAALEKQRQALELRKGGVGYRAIADRLGYKSPSSAHEAVETALRRTIQEPADEVRKLELERLDSLLMAMWPQAIATKEKAANPLAVDRVLRIMARRAAYLGLDAPVKFSIEKVVNDVAAELGMTSDETAATIADLTEMLHGRIRTP